ncbi:variable surface protein [Plasmodium gonderi]|uniref:Variable surface protein n=1 Tax=Plasmodium gonderi TaxID=77519 RepID=A0A1Y1JND7_PLAGO|nr:variable surface protein [Plasmodium gonderi]GAW83999.1 variable surface protein [Plasmodium gonderi]
MELCKNKGEEMYKEKCNELEIRGFGTLNEQVKYNCPQIMSYLYKIYEDNNNNFPEAGCKYLNYWIYHELLQKKYITGISSLYITLFSLLPSFYNSIHVNKFLTMYIVDTDLSKVTAIYYIYKCLNIVNDNQRNNKDQDFCNAIEVITNEYKPNIHTTFSGFCENNVIPSCKNTMFTPYGPYLSYGLQKIKNMWNNVNKEWDIIDHPGIINFNSREREYDILYH